MDACCLFIHVSVQAGCLARGLLREKRIPRHVYKFHPGRYSMLNNHYYAERSRTHVNYYYPGDKKLLLTEHLLQPNQTVTQHVEKFLQKKRARMQIQS